MNSKKNTFSNSDLNEAINQFISLASHKLFTPLTVIKLQVENLKLIDSLSTEAKKSIEDISINARKLEDFSDVLMKISDIKNGIFQIESTVDINSLINEIVHLQKEKIIEKKIDLKLNVSINVPVTIEFDVSYLRYALSVLLENAIQYNTNEGGISIDAKVGNGVLQIKVSDLGVGIPSSEHSKMFHPFYRAKNVQRLDVKGYGLSLFSVKLLMDKINGDIYFKSKENGGAIFFLEIPIKTR